jgi:hypothetical protein
MATTVPVEGVKWYFVPNSWLRFLAGGGQSNRAKEDEGRSTKESARRE